MIKFSNNVLSISSTINISFEHDIESIIDFENMVIVLLKIPSGIVFNENVFGIYLDGEIAWQIQKIFPDDNSSPYVHINKSANGLDAFNWAGVRVRVNMETGMVVHKRITK